ncbi:ethanolamine utilization protein [Streptococcus panodentis]|uniref:Ethanolamine utilization protein n=1 Tax=Streptococcus panodentis TaxID=1581472 RepID=A0ABS5AY11_9STRE|nr:ethanolamine utilization protein [Streptococcus panodentis]MBP2621321.1 ethanolamine utilization protein [Streptococcus panodentis]
MENIDKLVQLITDRLLENLQQASQAKRIYLLGQESTASLLLSEGYQLTQDAEEADCLLAENLSLDAYLRIASLCPINEAETLLLSALLAGKEVLAPLESFRVNQYKQSAKALLYRELQQQKAKLERYGLCFYEKDRLLAVLAPSQEKQQAAASACSGPAAKTRLITEGRLKEMGLRQGDEFRMDKGMIVTALARDYLKRHKIRIIE